MLQTIIFQTSRYVEKLACFDDKPTSLLRVQWERKFSTVCKLRLVVEASHTIAFHVPYLTAPNLVEMTITDGIVKITIPE